MPWGRCASGKGAAARPGYFITGSKLRHVLANRLNVSCHVDAPNIALWFAQPDRHADEVRQASHEVPVEGVDGSRANLHGHSED
jgi:hypothetical protein